MGVVNCSWFVQKKNCVEKETHEKNERKEKWKERKIQSKECVCCGKIEA